VVIYRSHDSISRSTDVYIVYKNIICVRRIVFNMHHSIIYIYVYTHTHTHTHIYIYIYIYIYSLSLVIPFYLVTFFQVVSFNTPHPRYILLCTYFRCGHCVLRDRTVTSFLLVLCRSLFSISFFFLVVSYKRKL